MGLKHSLHEDQNKSPPWKLPVGREGVEEAARVLLPGEDAWKLRADEAEAQPSEQTLALACGNLSGACAGLAAALVSFFLAWKSSRLEQRSLCWPLARARSSAKTKARFGVISAGLIQAWL